MLNIFFIIKCSKIPIDLDIYFGFFIVFFTKISVFILKIYKNLFCSFLIKKLTKKANYLFLNVFFINIRGSFKKKKKNFLCLNGIYVMQKVRGRVRGRVRAMVRVMVMSIKKKKNFKKK